MWHSKNFGIDLDNFNLFWSSMSCIMKIMAGLLVQYVQFFKEILETFVSSLIKRSQSNERERVRAGNHQER